jgi:hypothetical protein
MVPRKNDYRASIISEHTRGAFEKLQRLAMIIKGIARKYDYIGFHFGGRG